MREPFPDRGPERQRMVREQLVRRGIRDGRVLRAMAEVERELFVPPELAGDAYEDSPLPLESGQTISQPYIVARMTEELGLTGKEKVLEIGTGSGYQTAILARLAGRVFSIERDAILYQTAAARLRERGFENVQLRHGDGRRGWPEEAPFQAILVAAAASERPAALLEQMDDGGRLVLPVEAPEGGQILVRVVRKGNRWEEQPLTAVRFVPLRRGVN